jgi:hypothetical protein
MADAVKAIQKVFFDRPKVIAAIGRQAARVLARTGGFAKKVMSRGMRRRQSISAVGTYPSAHGGKGASLLRDLIFFGYDSDKKTVAIGPVLLTPDSTILTGTKKVPRLVNEGGRITRRVSKKGGGSQVVAQNYRPRPFVGLTAPLAAKALADNMAKEALK